MKIDDAVSVAGWLVVALLGVVGIVWGAETFAKHLSVASVRLGVSSFALALLLAGAEPEELATSVTASLRHAPGIAFGDVIAANVAICLVAIGVGAIIAALPFSTRVRRYALAGLPVGAIAAVFAWDGSVSRLEGGVLVVAYAVIAVIWVIERQVAAVVGSYAYNATMTLGAGALARPLVILDAASLHLPWAVMLASLVAVVIAGASGRITRNDGIALLACYPVFVALVLVAA